MNKNKKILPIIIIGSLIIGGIIWNTYQKRQQQKFGEKTVAEIISFKKVGGRINQYRLRYEFEVDDKEYQGSELVQYFECENSKIPGCKGEMFYVIYSKINPKNSTIELNQYERFKHWSPSL